MWEAFRGHNTFGNPGAIGTHCAWNGTNGRYFNPWNGQWDKQCSVQCLKIGHHSPLTTPQLVHLWAPETLKDGRPIPPWRLSSKFLIRAWCSQLGFWHKRCGRIGTQLSGLAFPHTFCFCNSNKQKDYFKVVWQVYIFICSWKPDFNGVHGLSLAPTVQKMAQRNIGTCGGSPMLYWRAQGGTNLKSPINTHGSDTVRRAAMVFPFSVRSSSSSILSDWAGDSGLNKLQEKHPVLQKLSLLGKFSCFFRQYGTFNMIAREKWFCGLWLKCCGIKRKWVSCLFILSA